jgi:inosose dehydratase
MRLGYHLATWIRDDHIEHFHRALDEISLTGWDGLELSGHLVVDRFGARPGELRDLLALHDLELASCYFRPSYRRERFDDDLALTRQVVHAAAAAGCRNVLIDGGEAVLDTTTTEDYRRVAEVANLVGSIARDAGLTCSWHQHWGTLFEQRDAFDALMELTQPELVRFCPDTAQLTMGDFDVLATFRAYAPRIGFVHFKDLDLNRPWQLTAAHRGPSRWSDGGAYHVDSKWRFVELGRGRIDFPALVPVLQEAGYDGWILVDLDYSAYPTRESSTIVLRYLRDGLGLAGRRGRSGWAS